MMLHREMSKKKTGYFYEEEEQAVLDYLNTDSADEKNRIFTEKLQRPFTKMIESIIRRYKLYNPDETFEETFDKTMSFLVTKFDKYNPNSGWKAYSYYQTIVKNFLIGRLAKRSKAKEKTPSYDDVANDINNSLRYTTQTERGAETAKETVDALIDRYKDILENPDEYGYTEDELSLCKALLYFFENWDFVLTTSGSAQLNKSVALFFLKEQTGMKASELSKCMKKFKKDFLLIKQEVVDS